MGILLSVDKLSAGYPSGANALSGANGTADNSGTLEILR